MVSKLRRKFVITAMSALLVILLVLISVINVSNFIEVTKSADELLTILAENDGNFPDMNPSFKEGKNDADTAGIESYDENVPSENEGAQNISQEGEGPQNSGDSLIPPEPRDEELKRDIYYYNKNIEAPLSKRYCWVKLD